ncbi:MFS transporter [Pseudomonas putida]|nr:MFS transporter [Pseudomonas putida]
MSILLLISSWVLCGVAPGIVVVTEITGFCTFGSNSNFNLALAYTQSILLGTFGAQGGTSVTLYTSIIYMLYFLQHVLEVDQTHTNLCLAVAIVIAAPCYPMFGAWSDRVGRSRVMLTGIVLWMLAAYPAFAGIRTAVGSSSWVTVSALISVLAVLTAMVMAPLPAFITEQFPPQSRTTGFGFAQQVSPSPNCFNRSFLMRFNFSSLILSAIHFFGSISYKPSGGVTSGTIGTFITL